MTLSQSIKFDDHPSRRCGDIIFSPIGKQVVVPFRASSVTDKDDCLVVDALTLPPDAIITEDLPLYGTGTVKFFFTWTPTDPKQAGVAIFEARNLSQEGTATCGVQIVVPAPEPTPFPDSPALALSLDTDTPNPRLISTDVRLIAELRDMNGNPIHGEDVEFEIIFGPNEGMRSIDKTTVNGVASFHYFDEAYEADSIDQITARAIVNDTVILSNPALVLWGGELCLLQDTDIERIRNSHVVIAEVIDSFGSGVSDIPVKVIISGAHSHISLPDQSTDFNGIATFVYEGKNTGIDTITGRFTPRLVDFPSKNQLMVTWESPTPSPTPTPSTFVRLLSFTATALNNGSVLLTWRTATEIDNAGFNIHRARMKYGQYKKINDTLIPPQGNAVSGASYSYVDTSPTKATYYYKLEDIDYYGLSTLHGPEKVRLKSGDSAGRRR